MCRPPSRNVRLPRGSFIFGSSIMRHSESFIVSVGISLPALQLQRFPLVDLALGQGSERKELCASWRPFVCLQQKMNHIDRLAADYLRRAFYACLAEAQLQIQRKHVPVGGDGL